MRHDLSAYKGHRVHIEFTPIGQADVQIVRVVQGTETPRHPLDPTAAAVLPVLAQSGDSSPESLSKKLGERWQQALQACAGDQLTKDHASAALVSWLLTHVNYSLPSHLLRSTMEAIRGGTKSNHKHYSSRISIRHGHVGRESRR